MPVGMIILGVIIVAITAGVIYLMYFYKGK